MRRNLSTYLKSSNRLGFSISVALLVMIGLTTCLASQEGDQAALNRGWVKINGPQIDQTNYLTLSAMSASPDSAMQENALDGIEQAIKNGDTGPGDPNIISLLSDICLKPLLTVKAPGIPEFSDLPMVRIRALKLTGLLGGDAAQDMLLAVLDIEQEPAVLAQAHQGLRQLQRAPTENEIRLIVKHLRSNYPNGPHNSLMLELLTDIQVYQTQYKNMARTDIFEGVMGLSEDTQYLQRVRTQARNVMKQLLGLL